MDSFMSVRKGVVILVTEAPYPTCRTESHFIVTSLSQLSDLAAEGLQMENAWMVIVSVWLAANKEMKNHLEEVHQTFNFHFVSSHKNQARREIKH